ncbi:MAG: flagellar biosynthesis anti-sigma factor FlgM [Nitrospirae bacterium]|nr:MAG: flagellar biosynthesis anti-sigma factor FlgM [Nitrospirota bacterium]
MKITGGKPPEGQEVYLRTQKTQGKDAVGDGQNAEGVKKAADQVELSGRAKEVENLKAEIAALPEIRQEKVEAIKKAIESGNYRIDPGKIAERIIDEL